MLSYFIAAAMLCTMLVGLGVSMSSCSDETAVLNVYNWGQYISDGSEGSLDVNAAFEEWYEKTHGVKIKVNYSTYASNEDMYAKLKNDAASYDVIIPSDYMIEQLIAEDMLEKLDYKNIPNFQYIADEYKVGGYDPTGEYTVPYTYGMVGVIYDSEVVKDTPTSWNLLWDPAYKGQILTFNNPRDAFGTAMYKLGIDVNTTNKDDWKKAYDALESQKELIQGYVMDEIFNKMKNGSAAIAPYYAGDFFTMYADNSKLAFYYPTEGTNVFVDAMCVPKGSQNKKIAEEYINFMLSEEAAVANAEYICYASPNTLVRENEGYKETLQELHPDAYEILYPESTSFMTSYYKNLDDNTKELMNSHWENLKIDSSIGIGVYILCAAIVIAIVAVAVVITVRKKKRANYDDDDDIDEDNK
jgi:spermidine/putrescine transport system substrate-binding protein